MNKYTKGSWTVKNTTELPEIWADDTIIVGMPDYDIGGVCTSMADAHLIAAAPRLYEALENLLECGRKDLSNPKYDGYFETARAALRQARGKHE